MADYIIALDQGTTSSRAIIFDKKGSIISVGQKEHEQIMPRAGWVEHDPVEIRDNMREVIGIALGRANLTRHDIAAIGITNQRETAVVWDKNTGIPVYNAIVWQDTRTQKICDELAGDEGPDRFKEICGLPLATYFAGPKIKWILDNVEGAREKADAGKLAFGTMDSWVLWNLTGSQHGGVHVTDVTNASRTMLMNVRTLEWDPGMCEVMGIPMSMLPEIRSCSEVYGHGDKESLIIDTPMILSGYLASFLTEEDTQYLLKQINAATPFPLRKEQVLVGTYGQYTQAAGAALYYVETFLNTL